MTPVLDGIHLAATVLALLTGLGALIGVIRNQLPGRPTAVVAGLLELSLLASVVLNSMALARAEVDVNALSLISYLVVLALIVPAVVAWAYVDGTRYGLAAVVVACLVVPVLLLRIQQIWEAAHVA